VNFKDVPNYEECQKYAEQIGHGDLPMREGDEGAEVRQQQ
jgi:hypothetical protein